MKESNLNFRVELDENNIPEKIDWKASDKPKEIPDETKALFVSVWDDKSSTALRMDLWTKEMSIDEMKMFYINTLGGMAQTILNSTNDEFLANETNQLVEKFVEYLKREGEASK